MIQDTGYIYRDTQLILGSKEIWICEYSGAWKHEYVHGYSDNTGKEGYRVKGKQG